MKAIYEPRGKAREYCELALNLYVGCSHKCAYCYVPDFIYKAREDFHQNVYPRKGIIEQLKKDAPKYSGHKVLLSFTSDPYQPVEQVYGITRRALQILVKNNITPVILTKGKIADRDFDLLSKGKGWYGATLTFLDEKDSLEWESGAALPTERIKLLKKAHQQRIKTWVSLEPVIFPEQTLEIIRKTYQFVDLYKIGKLNYHPLAKTIDWHKFLIDVTQMLNSFNKSFYIKKDLRLWRHT